MEEVVTVRSVSRIPIKFIVEDLNEGKGELIRFLAPRTVNMLIRKLPLEGRVALSRNEVYFEIPLNMGEEKSKSIVNTGTLAYWPMGRAFCIFYDKARPYSPVNPIGKVTENLCLFQTVKSGNKITVERL